MIIGARSAEVPCQVRPRGTAPWHWFALAGTENAVAGTFHASGLRLRLERADGGDVEVFLAPLREPARARALSALYRHFLLPETARILSGAYRDARMKTPTLVLVGADDPIGPEFLHGIDEHVDDLAMEYVE